MNNDLFFSAPYWRWIEKKLRNQNGPAAVIQKRTLNTATTILLNLRDVSFERLSSSLYFICEDIQMKELTHMYEAQLELAGASPDKFVKGLHPFFNSATIKIKKENMYEDFFDFISLCGQLRFRWKAEDNDHKINTTVADCYYSLLLQNLLYLQPNKFDLSTVICGMTTDGELMVTQDTFPNLDIPSYEIEKAIRNGEVHDQKQLESMIFMCHKRAGYDNVKTIEDMERLSNIDRIYTNQIAVMLPFINEFTFDILPKTPFSTFALPFYSIQNDGVDFSNVEEGLRHRNQCHLVKHKTGLCGKKHSSIFL